MSNPFSHLGVVLKPGSSVTPGTGYHNLPFAEYGDAPVHRGGTVERVRHIVTRYPVKGLRGLDIGCAVGGISFGLEMAGAQMVGVDTDIEAIRAAKVVAYEQKSTCRFYPLGHANLTMEEHLKSPFDFAVFFSCFMWVVKEKGMAKAEALMIHLAATIPVLWFETAQSEGDGSAWEATPFRSAADVRAFLLRFYPVVEDTGIPAGGWFPRNVFWCHR